MRISRTQVLTALGVLAMAGVVAPRPALAYLDPISGSVLLQVLVAGVLASVLGVKRFFGGLAARIRQRLGPRDR